jgi:hypothetical protein
VDIGFQKGLVASSHPTSPNVIFCRLFGGGGLFSFFSLFLSLCFFWFQVGRYLPSEQYYQHYDAFNLDEEDGRRFASNGGQRTVTVLIYLNNVERGGQTSFPSLQLQVRPVQGMALIFFPATVEGILDPRALHAALPAVDPKFVSQIWIRQGN